MFLYVLETGLCIREHILWARGLQLKPSSFYLEQEKDFSAQCSMGHTHPREVNMYVSIYIHRSYLTASSFANSILGL